MVSWTIRQLIDGDMSSNSMASLSISESGIDIAGLLDCEPWRETTTGKDKEISQLNRILL